MILRLVAISLIAAIMGGCSGKIVNYMDARQGCDRGVCDGIFYYRLTQHTTKYYQDKIVDKDGNVLRFSGGSGDKSCVPIEITEVKLVPEEHPSLITYKPGIFEDSKFNVGLGASGNITSVGVDATSGAKAAIEAVSTIASTAKEAPINLPQPRSKLKIPLNLALLTAKYPVRAALASLSAHFSVLRA